MFDTGRRTMESVLLEHAGHDVELYEFAEDGRSGITLWCNTCREPIIKHFIQGVWEEPQFQSGQRTTQGYSAPVWDVDEKDTWET